MGEEMMEWLKQCLEDILTALNENDLLEVRAIILEMMLEVGNNE